MYSLLHRYRIQDPFSVDDDLETLSTLTLAIDRIGPRHIGCDVKTFLRALEKWILAGGN